MCVLYKTFNNTTKQFITYIAVAWNWLTNIENCYPPGSASRPPTQALDNTIANSPATPTPSVSLRLAFASDSRPPHPGVRHDPCQLTSEPHSPLCHCAHTFGVTFSSLKARERKSLSERAPNKIDEFGIEWYRIILDNIWLYWIISANIR